jgi:hypothetical protein
MLERISSGAHSDADDRGLMALVICRAGYSFGARALGRYIMWRQVVSPPLDPETVLAESRAGRRAHGMPPLDCEAGELADEGLRDAVEGRRPRP